MNAPVSDAVASQRLASLDRDHRTARFYGQLTTPAEVLIDRLAAVVEFLNASTDPEERVKLHAEAQRLRATINQKERAA